MSPIIVGTNVFEGSDTPLAIDHSDVLRIRSEPCGVLEISVNISAPPAKTPLHVNANAPQSEGTDVEASADSVTVRVFGRPVIEVQRIANAIHLRLDLRPLGISVHSDDRALHLGSSALSGNTIRTSGVGITLSTREMWGSTAAPSCC